MNSKPQASMPAEQEDRGPKIKGVLRSHFERFPGSATQTLGGMLVAEKEERGEEDAKAIWEAFSARIFDLWRKLRRLPAGAMRAKVVHRKIDLELERALKKTPISCRAGCSACCRNSKVDCTDDEADLLAKRIRRGLELEPNWRARLEALGAAVTIEQWREVPIELRRCPFLVGDLCGVYDDRPFSCRKWIVQSDPKICEDPKGNSTILLVQGAEIAASAAFNLDDRRIEPMATKVLRRLT